MIKCELNPQIVELAPKQVEMLSLSITNQSQILDEFVISVQPAITPETTASFNPTWFSISPGQIPLRPGAADQPPIPGENQATIQLTLTLPPQLEAGSYAAYILVTARSGAANSTQLLFNLVVSHHDEERLEIQPREQSSRRRTAIYRLTLSNLGNAPQFYALIAEDSADLCHFQIKPAEVTLPPGLATAFTLKVRPRVLNWTGQDRRYPFKVRLENDDQEVEGLFIQKCTLPVARWMKGHWLPLTLLLAIPLILLGFFFIINPLSKATTSAATGQSCGPFSRRYVYVTSDNTLNTIHISSSWGSAETPPQDELAFTVTTSEMPALLSSLISISPDGQRLAYVTAKSLSLQDARVVIVSLNAVQAKNQTIILNTLTLPAGHALWPVAPVWSADGQKLALVSRDLTQAVGGGQSTPASSSSTSGLNSSPTRGGGEGNGAVISNTTGITAGAGVGSPPDATQLELWLADTFQPALSAAPARPSLLKTTLFYGEGNFDHYGTTALSPVLCWSSDDQNVLVRPRPAERSSITYQWAIKRDDPTKLSQENLPVETPKTPPPRAGVPGSFGALEKAGPRVYFQAPSAAGAGCELKHLFSQNDPRWSGLALSDKVAGAVGDWGCPVTAAAIVLDYHQIPAQPVATPEQVLACLQKLGLSVPFTPQSWQAVGNLCDGTANNPTAMGGVGPGGFVQADFSWGQLDNRLRDEGPVIVGLLGGPTGRHFVVVNSGHDGGSGFASSYGVVDPWDGSAFKTLEDFLAWGYRPRWLYSYSGPGLACGSGTTTTQTRLGLPREKLDQDLEIVVTGPENGQQYNSQQDFVGFSYQVKGGENRSLLNSKATIYSSQNLGAGPGLPPRFITSQVSPGQSVKLSEEGQYYININVYEGNSNQLLANRRLFFTIDRTPPLISREPALAPNSTTNQPVKLRLAAQDNLSGIARIVYAVSKNSQQAYDSDTLSDLIPFSDNGLHTIVYQAEDGAGNRSNPVTFSFSISNTVPNSLTITDKALEAIPLPTVTPAPAPTVTPANTVTPSPVPPTVTPPLPPGTTPPSGNPAASGVGQLMLDPVYTPQQVMVGQPLAVLMKATATNKDGVPVARVPIHFTVGAGASQAGAGGNFGTVFTGATDVVALTDETGVATAPQFYANKIASPTAYQIGVYWKSGSTSIMAAGGFSVTNLPLPASHLILEPVGASPFQALLMGNYDLTTITGTTPLFLKAQVTDLYANPVPGVAIQFDAPLTTTGASGFFQASSFNQGHSEQGISDPTGVATAAHSFVANGKVGTFQVSATLVATPTVSTAAANSYYSFKNTANLTVLNPGGGTGSSGGGNGQSTGLAGGGVVGPFQVKVGGAGGQAINGEAVSFTVSTGTATPQTGLVTSGPDPQAGSGIASFSGVKTTTYLGAFVITATLASDPTVYQTFTATSTALLDNSFSGSGNNSQLDPNGASLTLKARVIGYNNLGLSGVPVSFVSGDPTCAYIANSPANSDSNGIAQTTLIPQSCTHAYTVTATLSLNGLQVAVPYNLNNSLSLQAVYPQTPATFLVGITTLLQVKVVGPSGKALVGLTPTFTISDPGCGTLSTFQPSSAPDGIATAILTTGSCLNPYTITASLTLGTSSTSTIFNLKNTASLLLTASSSPTQTLYAGMAATTLQVRTTTDASLTTGVAGVSVTFQISDPTYATLSGGAATSISTSGDGSASILLTTTNKVGTYTVTAQATLNGLTQSVGFTLTNKVELSWLAVPGADLIQLTGGEKFPTLTVQARGGPGGVVPVPGVSVQLALSNPDAASLTPDRVATNANGLASTTPTSGNFIGVYTLTATVAGSGGLILANPVSLTLTNTAQFIFTAPMTDTIAITATTPVTYTPPLSVTIADFNKNPLPLASSATVTFTIIPIPSYPAGTGFSSPSPVSSTISIATSGPSFNIADLANYPGGKVFLRIGSSSIKSSFKIEITGSIGPLALRKKILTVLIN